MFIGGTKGGSGAHGFSIKFLDNFKKNLVNGHLTFHACCETYNEEFCDGNGKQRLDEHNLADYFWCLASLRYLKAMQRIDGLDLSPILTREKRRTSMDEFILDEVLPFLRPTFSRFWGLHFKRKPEESKALSETTFEPVKDLEGHLELPSCDANSVAFNLMPLDGTTTVVGSSIPEDGADVDGGGGATSSSALSSTAMGCGHEDCCLSMTVDGHMKNTRATCQHKESFLRTSDEIEGLWLQCPNEPM